MDVEASIHRLEGTTGQEQGGLIIRKKGPASDAEKHEFKKPSLPPAPQRSLLGLDKLAAARRQQQRDEPWSEKKSRVTSYHGDEEEVEDQDKPGRGDGRSHKDRYTFYDA